MSRGPEKANHPRLKTIKRKFAQKTARKGDERRTINQLQGTHEMKAPWNGRKITVEEKGHRVNGYTSSKPGLRSQEGR